MSGALNLQKELSRADNYRQIFAKLRQKVQSSRLSGRRAPVNKLFTLQWVLQSEGKITSYLSKGISQGIYFPELSSCCEVAVDKKRILYSLSWPDKICEALIAQLLANQAEPLLSSRLFSFRRGRSNLMAVREAGDFFADTTGSAGLVFVLKRDVASYGESIDSSILLEQLDLILGEQTPYIWQLLESFLRPTYRSMRDLQDKQLQQGLPAGFALTPVCENIYLSELDRKMENRGVFYARYGDDILVAGSDFQLVRGADEVLTDEISLLRLSFKEEKTRNLLISAPAVQGQFADYGYCWAPSMDYLGFNIDFKGEIFISENKIRVFQKELQRTARRAYLSHRRNISDKTKLVKAIINTLNLYFKAELQQPYLPLLLGTVNNTERLKKLDKWIAKQALRFVYKSGHDRVFRRMSYHALRRHGLLSLIHLRNLYLREYEAAGSGKESA